jgi:hypothetical protein
LFQDRIRVSNSGNPPIPIDFREKRRLPSGRLSCRVGDVPRPFYGSGTAGPQLVLVDPQKMESAGKHAGVSLTIY